MNLSFMKIFGPQKRVFSTSKMVLRVGFLRAPLDRGLLYTDLIGLE
jgi:hypothetical protein